MYDTVRLNWVERVALNLASWLVWRVAENVHKGVLDKDTVDRAVNSLPTLAVQAAAYQMEEVQWMDEFFARNFDPSIALSQATNRAVARKKELRDVLTWKQNLAMEYKMGKMRHIVRRS
jgi:hypothetical protein